jgi:Zn-dependent protease/CBS domain-containing protein
VNGSFQVARILGIPIIINLSWLLTLGVVTAYLALGAYPEMFRDTTYEDDRIIHWGMGVASGIAFFASILLHELAHSAVALRQGIPVQNITLFVFGGVSQIGGEARRPRQEFVLAIVGPLTSLLLGVVFLIPWAIMGFTTDTPFGAVLYWLSAINFVLAVFNMAPGFPMDGGRVLRAIAWGISGDSLKATRVATMAGRGLGYGLMVFGGLTLFGSIPYLGPWQGVWFIVLGMYLENSAKQSWFQAKAIDILGRHFAEDLMQENLPTVSADQRVHYVALGGNPRYIYFVTDQEDHVVGVLTQREVEAVPEADRGATTAGEVMRPTAQFPVALPREDAAGMLQRMENEQVWHLPVVSEGRAVGVVLKEDILRLLARNFFPEHASGAPPLPH